MLFCSQMTDQDGSNASNPDQAADASDVSSTGGAINLTSRPSSAPMTGTQQQPDSQESDQVNTNI